MTPEEIQQQLLQAMQEMAEVTKRQYEFQEKQYKDDKDLNEKVKKDKDNSLQNQQKNNKDLAEEAKRRLGVEETTNKDLKKTLDERLDIEKKVIERVKKQMGEEAFVETQRNRFFRDQLEKYNEGTTAYGGVITKFKDLDRNQQKAIVDGATTQRKLQEEKDKFAKTVQMLANPGQSIGEMKEKFSTLGGALDEGKESLIKLAGGGIGARVGLEFAAGAAKLLGSVFEGAAKAALTMGKSLVNGERGMSVGAKGVTQFTNSITGVVKALSDLAIGVGAFLVVISPFTMGVSALAGGALIAAGAVGKMGASAAETAAELNELAASLNDRLFAGFRELGKLSMTGAQGMTAIKDNLHAMGLTTAEFDKFKAVVSANAKEMKMFGANAEQGVNKFAQVSGELFKSSLGKTLELMGIGAEDQYEHTAKYLALQARLGFTEEKNVQNAAKATNNYIQELDKIAEITGASRKEQEEAREQVMAIEELRAGILDEQRKIKEGGGDQEQLRRMERAIEVASALQAQGLTRGAAGIAKYYGAGGAVTDNMSAEALQTFGKTIKEINEGTKGTGAISIGATRESAEMAGRVSSFRRYGASGEGIYGENLAKAADAKARLEPYEKLKAEAMKKEGAGFDEEKFIAAFNKQRIATDPTTVKNVDAARTQMEAAITLDKAVFKYNETVGINKAATDLFKKAVDKFAEITGLTGDGFDAGSGSGWDNASAGSGGGGNRALGRSSAASAGKINQTSQSDLQKQGLNIKQGDVQLEGAGVSEKLIEIAKQVQATIPGFKYFSAFNDKFHTEKASSSAHTRGRAFDFTLDHEPSKEEGEKIVSMLKQMGLDSVTDEYRDRSANATGGHFHAELKARMGGLFTGPSSGYPVELHGRESVWPENKLQDLVSSVKKESIDEYKKSILEKNTQTITENNSTDNMKIVYDMIDMLSVKLDSVVDHLATGNDYTDQILKYSRV